MGRTGWLAIVALGALAIGVGLRLHRPSAAPALACPPEEIRWVQEGSAKVARCAPSLPPTHVAVAQALAVGQKLTLNTATAEELAGLPGIGPSLANAIVRARTSGAFTSWDDVDRVPGIGPSKLAILQAHAVLGQGR